MAALDTVGTMAETQIVPNIFDQRGSLLFSKLPQEIRNMIYKELFWDTRLSYGERLPSDRSKWKSPPDIPYIKTVPSSSSLAILRCCSRARDEIGQTWIGQVLFHFDTPMDMMSHLTRLPKNILSKIRHLRVIGEIVHPLRPSSRDVKWLDIHRSIGWAQFLSPRWARAIHLTQLLSQLSGLMLDTLTVIGSARGSMIQKIHRPSLETFIKHGKGWKELRYIGRYPNPSTPQSRSHLLDYFKGLRLHLSNWGEALNRRDGVDTRPSIALYRSTSRLDEDCQVVHAKTRMPYQPLSEGSVCEFPDGGLEILYTVQRGRDINIETDGDPWIFFDSTDRFRNRYDLLQWSEIQLRIPSPATFFSCRIVEDSYIHADDMQWED